MSSAKVTEMVVEPVLVATTKRHRLGFARRGRNAKGRYNEGNMMRRNLHTRRVFGGKEGCHIQAMSYWAPRKLVHLQLSDRVPNDISARPSRTWTE